MESGDQFFLSMMKAIGLVIVVIIMIVFFTVTAITSLLFRGGSETYNPDPNSHDNTTGRGFTAQSHAEHGSRCESELAFFGAKGPKEGGWGCAAPENAAVSREASREAESAAGGHRTEAYLLGILNAEVKSGKFVPYGEYDPLPEDLYEFIPAAARGLLEAANPGADRAALVGIYNTRIAAAGRAKREGTLEASEEAFYRSAAHLTFDGWIPEEKLAFEYNGEYHYWPSGAELARICGNAASRETYLRRVRAEVERDDRKRRVAAAAGYRLILVHCTVPRAAFCDYIRSRLADFNVAREPPKTYFHPIPEPEIRKIDEAERIVRTGKVSRDDLKELREFVEDVKNHQTKIALEHIVRLHGRAH